MNLRGCAFILTSLVSPGGPATFQLRLSWDALDIHGRALEGMQRIRLHDGDACFQELVRRLEAVAVSVWLVEHLTDMRLQSCSRESKI